MTAISRSRRLRQSETGIISLMMTLVIIVVISLIVLGLAQLSRREQRQAADNQLSTQAFYAAESGVNDAQARLSQMIADGNPIPPKTNNCDPTAAPYNFNPNLEPTGGIAYTCLLIDPHPEVLTTELSASSQVLPLEAESGTLGSVELRWTAPDNVTAPVGNCTASNFPPAGSWSCPYGVLRIDLVDVSGGYGRTSLVSNTMSLFISPRNGGSGSASFSSSTKPNRYTAGCDANNCRFTIGGLSGTKYYLRATEIYQSGGVLSIRSPGNKFVGAQAVIDSTGKAQDVLRRIRVALDISGVNKNRTATAPLISGETICKQFWAGVPAWSSDPLGTHSGPDSCTP